MAPFDQRVKYILRKRCDGMEEPLSLCTLSVVRRQRYARRHDQRADEVDDPSARRHVGVWIRHEGVPFVGARLNHRKGLNCSQWQRDQACGRPEANLAVTQVLWCGSTSPMLRD